MPSTAAVLDAFLRQFGIISGDDATLTSRHDLAFLEAECGHISQGTDFPPLVDGAVGMSRILNDD